LFALHLFHEKYGFDQVGTQEIEGGTKEVSLMAIDLPNN
jgi:predicted GNAT superfamily acetyltransferase